MKLDAEVAMFASAYKERSIVSWIPSSYVVTILSDYLVSVTVAVFKESLLS